MKQALTKLSKICLYLTVFLIPLFFLPWTANVLDFPKQVLLLLLVFLSLIFWLISCLIEGKIRLNFNWFNWIVLLFLAVLGISTYFSFYPYGSFWGLPLDVNQGFVTGLGLVLFYFLVVNVFKKKEIFNLLFVFIVSGFLAGLFGILQIFRQFVFPFDFSRMVSFNTIGSVNSLAIFAGSLLPLLSVLIFMAKGIKRILLVFFGISLLVLLFVVNFWVAWIVLFAGAAILFVVGITKREIFKINWLSLPIFLLALGVIFGFLKISLPGLPSTPLEVSPSHQATWEIAVQTLKDSPLVSLVGSGPGTFVYNYSRFKSEVLNQTNFWATRFNTGASEILDKLATLGILGLVSFLAILVGIVLVAIKSLKGEEKTLGLGIFAGWLGVVVAFFFYPANLSLNFLFWTFTASLVAISNEHKKSWDFENYPKVAVLTSFVFIFLLIIGILLSFWSIQRYLAEVDYLKGLKAIQTGDNQLAINYISRAISKTNGKQDNYWRDLAQVYIFRINEEFQKGTPPESLTQTLTPLFTSAVNSAKTATDLSPKSVANWAVRGFVYRSLIGLVGGSEEWATISYKEATNLEPTNPYLWTELGRVYLERDEIEKAKENLNKAISLKPDYAPAHFQMARVFVKEGKTKEAIDRLEATKWIAPFDSGLAFQLGLLYYQDKQFEKARGEFERAVILNPNYSNARYYLGLIYDTEGKKEEAIEQFEKIAELNPDNSLVKKILENLKNNKPALEGITPSQPPIEELPPERIEK